MLTYSRERAKNVDLFPRTDNTHKNHARPISANGQNEKYSPDIKVSLSFHVEMVVSLSHKKADTHINIDVEFGDGKGQIKVPPTVKTRSARMIRTAPPFIRLQVCMHAAGGRYKVPSPPAKHAAELCCSHVYSC